MIKTTLRILLAAFYGFAGYMHLVRPEPFLSIMPGAVPFPEQVILWTGIAEILGALAIVQPFHLRLRQAGGVGLALYALCVWPANINHFILDMAHEDGGLGLAYHVPRMFAQPVIIWLALWVVDVPMPWSKASEPS
ncbi:MAG: DoxX family protein [Pseudomonadota bacterium]